MTRREDFIEAMSAGVRGSKDPIARKYMNRQIANAQRMTALEFLEYEGAYLSRASRK